MNTGAENFLLSINNGQKFFTKYMANDDFLNSLDALIPKIPFSFFADFGSRSLPRPGGQVSLGFRGSHKLSPFWGRGGSSHGALLTPPPFQLQARLPQGFAFQVPLVGKSTMIVRTPALSRQCACPVQLCPPLQFGKVLCRTLLMHGSVHGPTLVHAVASTASACFVGRGTRSQEGVVGDEHRRYLGPFLSFLHRFGVCTLSYVEGCWSTPTGTNVGRSRKATGSARRWYELSGRDVFHPRQPRKSQSIEKGAGEGGSSCNTIAAPMHPMPMPNCTHWENNGNSRPIWQLQQPPPFLITWDCGLVVLPAVPAGILTRRMHCTCMPWYFLKCISLENLLPIAHKTSNINNT